MDNCNKCESLKDIHHNHILNEWMEFCGYSMKWISFNSVVALLVISLWLNGFIGLAYAEGSIKFSYRKNSKYWDIQTSYRSCP